MANGIHWEDSTYSRRRHARRCKNCGGSLRDKEGHRTAKLGLVCRQCDVAEARATIAEGRERLAAV
jgi:hypothetical protein